MTRDTHLGAFIEHALTEFGLKDSFDRHPQQERIRCALWISESEDRGEMELRISELLDVLCTDSPLPARTGLLAISWGSPSLD